MTHTNGFDALHAHAQRLRGVAIPTLLAAEPQRPTQYARQVGPLYFNFARQKYDRAALDALFGGIRAALDGLFDDKVFVVSFLSNVVVAARMPWAAAASTAPMSRCSEEFQNAPIGFIRPRAPGTLTCTEVMVRLCKEWALRQRQCEPPDQSDRGRPS